MPRRSPIGRQGRHRRRRGGPRPGRRDDPDLERLARPSSSRARLVDRRLTVITNALDVATILLDRPGIELVVLGGVVRRGMHSTLGHIAELALRELRADALYMGIGAIGPDLALMNDSIPEILTDRALRRASRDCVVLADATKFHSVAPAFVFDIDQVDDADHRRATWIRRCGGAPSARGRRRDRAMTAAIIPARDRGGARGHPPDRGARREARARATSRPRLRGDTAMGVRGIHVIGNGTSYHSSLAAAALYGRHAGAG